MRWLVLQRHDMVPHRRRGPIIARSFTTFPDTPTEKHLLRLLMPHVHALFERWRMGDFCCLTSLPVKCVRIRPNITEPIVGSLWYFANSYSEPMALRGRLRAHLVQIGPGLIRAELSYSDRILET
ncbi:hypothetical protein QCA50_005617 [Cerrena zonata]|uniref:Uncharacterized protein n=1 Tax=Cerrena zonata TaxID=2478898 RepID=A0AAW0GLL1_9APHY